LLREGIRVRRTRSSTLWLALACFATALTAAEPRDSGGDPSQDPIFVTGERAIVINGHSRRCRPLHEPIDSFAAISTWGKPRQSIVLPSGKGGFVLVPDSEPITGPTHWQRVGTGLDQYVFRSPPGRGPLCIGSKWPSAEGWGQLRRIVDASPYTGKRVRFTAWVASNKATLIRFWLAAGHGTSVLYNGGNTDNQPWGGSHGWTPVMLEAGPIARGADHISYGFLLYGGGDVWLYDPKLEVVPEAEARSRKGDVAVIGTSR
jgi:hypothetical protein